MDQLLSIQPEKILKFTNSDNKYTSSILLTNISSVFVAFKIRISNQGDYLVKPSIGVLRAGNSISLSLSTINKYIQEDKVQLLAGPISMNEDVIEYFKKQPRVICHVLKCTLEGQSTISALKSTDIDELKSTIKTEYAKPVKKMHQTKETLLLEQIKQISEEIKAIKEKQNSTIGIKQFLLTVVISVIIGVYIAYR